jgi:choline dehydrogenase-like flavoprotein
MSRKDEEWGVVDPDLRLKGVEGLRIVDASVFVSTPSAVRAGCRMLMIFTVQPYIPTAHTQVPTYIFAERAADLIKETYGLI